jgi:hypothetical protein
MTALHGGRQSASCARWCDFHVAAARRAGRSKERAHGRRRANAWGPGTTPRPSDAVRGSGRGG